MGTVNQVGSRRSHGYRVGSNYAIRRLLYLNSKTTAGLCGTREGEAHAPQPESNFNAKVLGQHFNYDKGDATQVKKINIKGMAASEKWKKPLKNGRLLFRRVGGLINGYSNRRERFDARTARKSLLFAPTPTASSRGLREAVCLPAF